VQWGLDKFAIKKTFAKIWAVWCDGNFWRFRVENGVNFSGLTAFQPWPTRKNLRIQWPENCIPLCFACFKPLTVYKMLPRSSVAQPSEFFAFHHCASECRHQCMRLFFDLVKLLPETRKKSPVLWMKEKLDERGPEYFLAKYAVNLVLFLVWYMALGWVDTKTSARCSCGGEWLSSL